MAGGALINAWRSAAVNRFLKLVQAAPCFLRELATGSTASLRYYFNNLVREPRVCVRPRRAHEFPFAALWNCVARFAVTKATSRSNWPQLARPRQRPTEIERVIKLKLSVLLLRLWLIGWPIFGTADWLTGERELKIDDSWLTITWNRRNAEISKHVDCHR